MEQKVILYFISSSNSVTLIFPKHFLYRVVLSYSKDKSICVKVIVSCTI
ncbi:unnamed protein product [Schistosoma margrebowiei]|uniref:Uncharacterized protein n=1 Tax=Schistosoma margrebowiei TaxID=48269 RepID=A0A3P7X1E8_9TREM|nr:unnamed protein product [Schistosoma margrebowiei]